MTANELRIGNWVEFQAANGAWYPRSFEITDYRDFEDENTSYRAIPLTEEVLLKCGFKKWGRDDMPRTISYELGRLHIFPANSFCDFEGYGFMHVKKEDQIESALFTFQHLHTLQNIAFLLGQELTYTP